MHKRDVTFFLVDVLIAIDKIIRYVKPFPNANQLLYHETSYDAVIRELEVIGEAVKYLSKNDSNQQLPPYFRRVIDFRNSITHGYFRAIYRFGQAANWQIV